MQFDSKRMFHIMISYEPFSTGNSSPCQRYGKEDYLERVWPPLFFVISCLTDIGVLLNFETALSFRSNKNPVEMQAQKIHSGKVYNPV